MPGGQYHSKVFPISKYFNIGSLLALKKPG